jgi:hypothetical protein
VFEKIELEILPETIIEQIRISNLDELVKIHLLSGLMNLDWWSDLNLSDQNKADLSKVARGALFKVASSFTNIPLEPGERTKNRHAVFVGQIVHLLHSPTRGAFDYIRALNSYEETTRIDVFYTGKMTPDIESYADEVCDNNIKINYINIESEPNWLETAIRNGPYTYHFWCEPHLSVQIGIMALFGPSVMFTTGHVAPVQYSDVYWYSHDVEYVESLWKRTGAPDYFIENYVFLKSAPLFVPKSNHIRSRNDFGIEVDDIVLTSVGNQ